MKDVDWAALLVRHRPALRRFVRCLVSSEDEVDEIVQDVAVAVFTHRSGPVNKQNFRRWCCGLARHIAAHRRRSAARSRLRFVEDSMLGEAAASLEDPERAAIVRQSLSARLGALNAPKFRLLFDRYVLEESSSELAARMNVSAAAVRMKVSRVLAALRNAHRDGADKT